MGGMNDITASAARRTGATWVAATGAFLLVAAAAVFVAVRWDDFSNEAKLAVVAGLTGGFLIVGAALRSRLPATGEVLFHLGAFLLPVDLAAIGVHVGADWRALLLAEGLLGVGVYGAMARATGSVVLGWVTVVSVPVVANGIAALTHVPAPLALAVLAVGTAVVARWSRHTTAPAAVFALVAGYAPVLTLASSLLFPGHGVLVELGWLGAPIPAAAVVAGVLSGVVLAAEAQRRGDVGLGLVALGAPLVGAGAAVLAADLGRAGQIVAASAAFVVVEVAAVMAGRDRFWRAAVDLLARAAEVVAGLVATAGIVLVAAVAAVGIRPSVDIAAAFGLVALGLAIASARRGGLVAAEAGAAVAALAAVAAGTGSPIAVAGSAVGLAAVIVATRRLGAMAAAATFLLVAPLVVARDPLAALVIGLCATAVCGVAVVVGREPEAAVSVGLVTAAMAGIFGWTSIGGVPALEIYIVCCLLLGVLADGRSTRVGHVARVFGWSSIGATVFLTPGEALIPALLLTVLAVIEAVRLDEPRVAHGAAVPAVVAAASVGLIAGLSFPEAGLAVLVAGVVWAGLAGVVSPRWRMPLLVTAGVSVVVGFALAANDPRTVGPALILSGGLVLGAGVASSQESIAHLGGALTTLGIWAALSHAQVVPIDLYALPLGAHLAIAGFRLRAMTTASSWTAYAPAVTVLAGTAVAERLHHGGGEHALLAGAVAVVAVAAGGWKRLAAPLFLGTVTLVVLTVHESFGVVAGVPTWGWLALGGSALLATGVALELTDTSPVDAGRKVVDVLADNFE